MGIRFLPITPSFFGQFRISLYGCAQETKSYRLSTLLTTFGLKIKMPNFRPIFGHGCGAQPNWRRGLKISPKVSPMNGVFWPTHISKIIFPNKNQLPLWVCLVNRPSQPVSEKVVCYSCSCSSSALHRAGGAVCYLILLSRERDKKFPEITYFRFPHSLESWKPNEIKFYRLRCKQAQDVAV